MVRFRWAVGVRHPTHHISFHFITLKIQREEKRLSCDFLDLTVASPLCFQNNVSEAGTASVIR
jgi:hypothetical protein